MPARPPEPEPAAAAVALRNITLYNRRRPLLRNVSWTLPRGGRGAILGPNGCGKTTLLRIATGYGHLSDGVVELLGETLGDTDVRTLRRRIGVVDPAAPHLFDERVTVAQAAATGFAGHFSPWFDEPSAAQQAAADAALAAVGLAGRGQQWFGTLSTGERRRVLLARALAPRPELLALDEAAAGLDLAARESLLATLHRTLQARPETTLLMVTHWLEELPPGLTHVLLMSEGAAVAAGWNASHAPSGRHSRTLATSTLKFPPPASCRAAFATPPRSLFARALRAEALQLTTEPSPAALKECRK